MTAHRWCASSRECAPTSCASRKPLDCCSARRSVAASRTIYASHYFRDGLEVKHIVPVSAERSAFYLLSVNRSHSESLLGF